MIFTVIENRDKEVWPDEEWVSHFMSKRWPEPEKCNLLIQIPELGNWGLQREGRIRMKEQ